MNTHALALDNGAFIDEKTRDLGMTSMHIAVRNGRLKLVNFLLERGADINAKCNANWTPLTLARKIKNPNKHHLDIISFLEEEEGIKKRDRADVWEHMDRGNIKPFKDLLNKSGLANGDIFTPIVYTGDSKLAKIMIEKKCVGVDDPINYSGMTPLHLAARYGHFELVKVLVENGAEINVKCSRNYTPLMFAEKMGHKEIVDFLSRNSAETVESM